MISPPKLQLPFPEKSLSQLISKRYHYRFPEIYQGQKSAQGILHLRNPNLGPNSAKRILDARILDPSSWVEFLDSVFSSKRGPLKNSPSRNSPPKIHPSKFNPEIGQKIHIAPLQGHLCENVFLNVLGNFFSNNGNCASTKVSCHGTTSTKIEDTLAVAQKIGPRFGSFVVSVSVKGSQIPCPSPHHKNAEWTTKESKTPIWAQC